jgi:hypothetical protein
MGSAEDEGEEECEKRETGRGGGGIHAGVSVRCDNLREVEDAMRGNAKWEMKIGRRKSRSNGKFWCGGWGGDFAGCGDAGAVLCCAVLFRLDGDRGWFVHVAYEKYLVRGSWPVVTAWRGGAELSKRLLCGDGSMLT